MYWINKNMSDIANDQKNLSSCPKYICQIDKKGNKNSFKTMEL